MVGFPSGQREQTVNLPPNGFGGSTPPPTTRKTESGEARRSRAPQAGIAQLAEHKPSKLRVAGSSPVSRSATAHVAQEVEHLLGKEEVIGSSPIVGSLITRPQYRGS